MGDWVEEDRGQDDGFEKIWPDPTTSIETSEVSGRDLLAKVRTALSSAQEMRGSTILPEPEARAYRDQGDVRDRMKNDALRSLGNYIRHEKPDAVTFTGRVGKHDHSGREVRILYADTVVMPVQAYDEMMLALTEIERLLFPVDRDLATKE